MTFDEMLVKWRDERYALRQVAEYSVLKSYNKARNYSPFLGERDICEIKKRDVNAATSELFKKPQERGYSGNPVSSTTVCSYFTAARCAYRWAVDNEYCELNPFSGAIKPKKAKPRMRFLTPQQARDEYAAAKESAYSCEATGDYMRMCFAAAVAIAIQTGMRRGEIFALDWDAVDGHVIHVRSAIKASPDGSHIEGFWVGPPKTEAGNRDIHVGQDIVEFLGWLREAQRFYVPDAVHVLSNLDGNYLSLNYFEHWWIEWRQMRPNLNGVRFHDLRHTHATLLIGSGVDVKTVQARLGHSSADMTLNVYSHALPENDVKAASLLEEVTVA